MQGDIYILDNISTSRHLQAEEVAKALFFHPR